MNFDRITVEPEKLEGKPSVCGLRITVETVVRLVAAGWTFDEILAEYDNPGGKPVRLHRIGDDDPMSAVNVRYRPASE